MNRVTAACLTAFLACSVPALPAQAQISSRAYAPENLRSLSSQDQQRVIAQEYAEQSGGRRIPDDQMRFYLDQVNRSSWGFSRIKQDIATSLGGSGGGWNPGGGNNGVVRCESNDNRQRVCTTGWRSAQLSRQISGTRCVEGSNWGSRNGQVWVSGGCRAEFSEGRGGGWNGGGPGGGGGNTIRCESQDNRERTCATGWRNATLVRQISGTACVEGQTWGVRNGAIWVNRGCRGEFAESRGNWGGGSGGGNSNYSVTCSSNDKRQQTCAWDSRQGRPALVQQLSGTACVEGRSWGYRNGTLWVSGGCRARFGAR